MRSARVAARFSSLAPRTSCSVTESVLADPPQLIGIPNVEVGPRTLTTTRFRPAHERTTSWAAADNSIIADRSSNLIGLCDAMAGDAMRKPKRRASATGESQPPNDPDLCASHHKHD